MLIVETVLPVIMCSARITIIMPRLPFRSTQNKEDRYRLSGDDKLIAACLNGDAEAWDALVDRYASLIYSVCVRAGLSGADAEDTFQDVCVILLNHLTTLRDTAKLSSWLISTTRREAWRQGKWRNVRLASELGEGEWEMESAEGLYAQESDSPEAGVLALEQQQMMREGLSHLPDRCRKLLTLLYNTETPPAYADLAVLFDLPIGSIGPTRARCLQNLRKILSGMDY
jgi:RNA polymerase sigma factor (sigma-70 family)